LANRPPRSRVTCSPCFIWSRSGFANLPFPAFAPAQRRSMPRGYNTIMAMAWLPTPQSFLDQRTAAEYRELLIAGRWRHTGSIERPRRSNASSAVRRRDTARSRDRPAFCRNGLVEHQALLLAPGVKMAGHDAQQQMEFGVSSSSSIALTAAWRSEPATTGSWLAQYRIVLAGDPRTASALATPGRK
jgi:hypothetical protein